MILAIASALALLAFNHEPQDRPMISPSRSLTGKLVQPSVIPLTIHSPLGVRFSLPHLIPPPPPPPQITPNDTLYLSHQNALRWSKFDYAWATETGSADVVIASVDTGCSLHNDLTINVTRHSVLGDAGYDTHGHGTRMASILCADTDNQYGIAAPAWRVDFHSVKVLESSFASYTAGFELARNIPDVRVIIVELDPLQSGIQNSFWTKVRQFMNSGGIVLMPAGNRNLHATADIAEPDVIVTSGLNIYSTPPERWTTGVSTYGSNWGPMVDMCCPVDHIMAVHNNPDVFSQGQGTSGTSPHLAGAIALILSARPDLTPDEVKDCLFTTAVQPVATQGTWNEEFGWGYLDAEAALAAAIALP
jgi:subtilisin family serine protease